VEGGKSFTAFIIIYIYSVHVAKLFSYYLKENEGQLFNAYLRGEQLQVRPEPTQVDHLSNALLYGRLLKLKTWLIRLARGKHSQWEERYQMGDNLKVVWAEFSTLS
jgi:hypothetical protein